MTGVAIASPDLNAVAEETFDAECPGLDRDLPLYVAVTPARVWPVTR